MTPFTNSAMRLSSKAWRLTALAGALAFAALGLSACFQTEPGGGTESSDGIRLTGRVVGTDLNPVAGVVVRLTSSGLTDTTDALGRYVLTGDAGKTDGEAFVLDTLRYFKNGQSLARVSVLQWVDTLPDVQLIQRDISGLLNATGHEVARVEAVLTGDGIDSANPVIAEFYHNTISGNYSGFLYFAPTAYTAHYAVSIKVYGPGNKMIGQSVAVPFNSFAGNITVPEFSAGNSKPSAFAGTDTAVALSALVQLRGPAVDSFGGAITKWEWSIDGAPFVETSSGDTSFSRPSHGAYPCILRITDNDGNQAVDTVFTAFTEVGTAWTTRTSGVTASLTGITWTGTQFVAVGSSNTILTSPDGIAWTVRRIDTTTTNISLNGVVWTGQKLIAVTNGGGTQPRYFSSTDGITWSTNLLPYIGASGAQLVSVADSTLFIASQSSTSRFITRSEDHGATWYTDTLPRGLVGTDGPGGIWTFTRHSGRLVGVGMNGLTASSSGNGVWTRHTSTESFPRPHGGVYDYTMTSVVSAGSHVVAVGFAGHVMRSADGINWPTPRVAAGIPNQAAGSSTGDLHGVVWTGNALVAVGNGTTVLSADGGVNWAKIPAAAGNFRSIAWNGTRMVAVGSSGTIISTP
jgi:hypothetical protein